ncbi:MAG: hypothetical protein ABSC53_15940 [Bacteroidota bacterium]
MDWHRPEAGGRRTEGSTTEHGGHGEVKWTVGGGGCTISRNTIMDKPAVASARGRLS